MTNREAARRREQALAGEPVRGVRPHIRDSWLRARHAGVRPDAYVPPVALTDDQVRQRRARHPLAPIWPVLCAVLQPVTTEPAHLLFLSDADGHLLWTRGDRATVRLAERVHLVPGALWSEQAAGTSGVGTALALQRPFQVLGAEHYLSAANRYACTAVPIRHPATGDLLGAVDLTAGLADPPRLAMSLLVTAARLAEAQLYAAYLRRVARLRERYADRLTRRVGGYAALVAADGTVIHTNRPRWLPARVDPIAGEGPVALPGGRPATAERLSPDGIFLVTAAATDPVDQALRFEGLGRPRALLQLAGSSYDLSRRHSEIVAVLLAHPGGLPAAALAHQVYGPGAKPVTLRAEISRLRAVLGHRLRSDPYRITGETTADFLAPLSPRAAILLPGSDAPGIRALRRG